jgi:hypothetical protein
MKKVFKNGVFEYKNEETVTTFVPSEKQRALIVATWFSVPCQTWQTEDGWKKCWYGGDMILIPGCY